MQIINQFSALLLLIVPFGAFVFWLRWRHRFPTRRWPLLGLGIGSTALIFYLLAQFQTGAAGTTAGRVEAVFNEASNGRPVFIELYSDY